MSNWGDTKFVIEGEKGRLLYDKIMKAIEACTEFDKEYAFDEVGGRKYVISKFLNQDGQVEYIACVQYNENISIGSWFNLDDIQFEDGHLCLVESFSSGYGAIEVYACETQLYKDPGFFYYKTSESNFIGSTNDENEKYFMRLCEYVVNDPDSGFASQIPADFYDQPYTDQVAFCEAHPEEITYYVTQIADLDSI